MPMSADILYDNDRRETENEERLSDDSISMIIMFIVGIFIGILIIIHVMLELVA